MFTDQFRMCDQTAVKKGKLWKPKKRDAWLTHKRIANDVIIFAPTKIHFFTPGQMEPKNGLLVIPRPFISHTPGGHLTLKSLLLLSMF